MTEHDPIPEHDHSTTDAGGATLRPTDVVTKETPLVDVRGYGVVGDGATDDAAALQAAVDAATPRGVLFIPANLDVSFETTIDIDLGADESALMDGTAAQTPFALRCEGQLSPAAGIGDGLHLHHAVEPSVFVRFQGGGADAESSHALHVTDTLGGVYEGFANNYNGTVFTFSPGNTRVSGVKVGWLRASGVGRELLMAGTPDRRLGADGGVGTIEDVWGLPRLGMEFRHVNGLKLDQYENVVGGITRRGNLFADCTNVAIDKFAVGGSTELDELVEFRNCENVQVGAIFAHAMPGTGVVIDSVRHAQFERIFVNTGGEVGVDYRQSGELETGENRLQIDTQGTADRCLLVREEVTGANHYFTGTFAGTSRPTTVASSDAERVVFHDATLESVVPDEPALLLPADNDVYVTDSIVHGIDAPPRLLNGVGQGEGSADTPDADAWAVGTLVEYTDTDDGSGSGLYQLFPLGWVRLADAPTDPDDIAADDAPEDDSGGNDDSADADSGEDGLPAPGLLATVASVGGATYLWNRRDSE